MEPLTLQLRHGDEETIECWDDDGDLQCNEDIQLRSASCATSVTNYSTRRSGHRDSISSRLSARSDLESNAGDDEDWQVHLLENDDRANEEAIASAKSAGIPLPSNVPKSALIGGTIKRLGRRKPRRNLADDWSEDVEFPDSGSTLRLKDPGDRSFPETLRQVNSTATSPVKSSPSPFWCNDISGRLHSASTSLERFRDNDDSSYSQDVPTIRLPQPRPSQQTASANHDIQPNEIEDKFDIEHDFELPDDAPLKLSPLKITTRNSNPFPEDFDLDWSEGSIGLRFGGTAKDRRSNPSSSVSIASPSVSSCLTGESEDDGFDGLIIPDEPLNLETSLKKRQEPTPVPIQSQQPSAQGVQQPTDSDDFFNGIEIAGGDDFAPNNLSLNPNVKCKTERPESPVRRSATTITFTNTAASPRTRIPRLSGHERPHSTHLETVSESGAPLSNFRRSRSRLHGNNLSRSSVSSLPVTSTSPTSQATSRRLLGTRIPKDSSTRGRDPAGKQLLSAKRSMPTMRAPCQGVPISTSQHQDGSDHSFARPKTPVDRIGGDTKLVNRKIQTPFIPAGASDNQSHHVTVKTHRHSRRTHSDSSGDAFHLQGSTLRIARPNRTNTFGNNGFDRDSSPKAVAGKRTLTRPARRRNFGDGTELELFDDLPTSFSAENRFIKNPTGRGAPRSLRRRLSQSQTIPPRTVTPTQPPTPVAAFKTPDSTPRFARDTNASRNSREQRIASMTMNPKHRETNSLPSLSANWRKPSMSRIPSSSTALRNKKGRSMVPSTKPHLIKPMGSGVQEAKCKLSCQDSNLCEANFL